MLITDTDFDIAWDLNYQTVNYYIKKFSTINPDDLKQEARLCLFRCLTTYHSEKANFSTYLSKHLFFSFNTYNKRLSNSLSRRTNNQAIEEHQCVCNPRYRYYALDFLRFIKDAPKGLMQFKIFYRNRVLGQTFREIAVLYNMPMATIFKDLKKINEYVASYNAKSPA